MADTNGTRATATNLGSIGATGISHSNSVGGAFAGTPSVFDRADFFSFNAPDSAEYQLTLSTTNRSFVGYVSSDLTTPAGTTISPVASFITGSVPTISYNFKTYSANANYVLDISRFEFASTDAAGKARVDYNLEIKPVNFSPDSILAHDLKSSYRQNESISLNQLYVNDRDGWGDVKNLTMHIIDPTTQRGVKFLQTNSFTKWDGGTTWAQTSLNLSLKDLALGTYTVRFGASDSRANNIADRSRQITIVADPLTGMTDSVYRFYNGRSGVHFYTSNTAERDSLIGNPNMGYQYEGPAFKVANSQSDSSQLPLFRFYNTAVGNHFYTASVSERDSIVSNLPQYQYEGPAFHVLGASANVGTDMYRFFNTQTGAHFYTASAAERDSVIASLPAFTYEGAVFEVAM